MPADASMLVSGMVDAAFLEPDGWVLVDYQTGSVLKGTAQKFVDYYRAQVGLYKEAWQSAAGQPAKGAVLWFVGLGETFTI